MSVWRHNTKHPVVCGRSSLWGSRKLVTHCVFLALWQFLLGQQVLVLLIVDLQHGGLHGKAPPLLAQAAAALKHLYAPCEHIQVGALSLVLAACS